MTEEKVDGKDKETSEAERNAVGHTRNINDVTRIEVWRIPDEKTHKDKNVLKHDGTLQEQRKVMAENIEESEKNAEKYLFLANAGAILSVAALYSKTNLLNSTHFIPVALITTSFFLFFIGLALVGVLHMLRVMYGYKVKVSWEKDYQELVRGDMGFEVFNTRHYKRAGNRNPLKYTALLAFGIYIFALILVGVVAAYNVAFTPQSAQVVKSTDSVETKKTGPISQKENMPEVIVKPKESDKKKPIKKQDESKN